MGSEAYNLQVLIYDATLNFSRWSTLSFTVEENNSITGTLEYTGPPTQLTGQRIPGEGGSKVDYELDGAGVSIRLSAYPDFGTQYPVAGVGSIDAPGPFYIIGKRS
jgi:hypothetical protein